MISCFAPLISPSETEADIHFLNSTSRTGIEAEITLVLTEGATVSGFEVDIDHELVQGVVVGLGSLADATRDTGPGIPAATAQVVVGQGDTVWDIARRTAPDADPAAAAAHIAELNGLHSAALRPGQVLTAPAA